MSDCRPYCIKCSSRMNCLKNGYEIVCSLIAYQSGDLYQCPVCGHEIVIGLGKPYTKNIQNKGESNEEQL